MADEPRNPLFVLGGAMLLGLGGIILLASLAAATTNLMLIGVGGVMAVAGIILLAASREAPLTLGAEPDPDAWLEDVEDGR